MVDAFDGFFLADSKRSNGQTIRAVPLFCKHFNCKLQYFVYINQRPV